MTSAVITAVAWLVGWFAANKIDGILGHWFASIAHLWDSFATPRMRTAHQERMAQLAVAASQNFEKYEAARKRILQKAGILPPDKPEGI